MITKRFFLIIIFVTELLSLSAQENEEYRLRALSFFCSKKSEIMRVSNPILGDVSPIFILDIRMSDAEEFYIDSNQFNPDSLSLEYLLQSMTFDDFIYDNQFDSSQPTEINTAYSFLCNCIYCDPILTAFMDSVLAEENISLCKREYGLSISRVIHYRGLNCVVLKISSFFKAKVDRIQFCIIEFSKDQKNIKCRIGNGFIID